MFQDIRFLRFKKPHKNVKHDFRHNIFSISLIIGRGHLLSLALCLHECLFPWIYIFVKRFGLDISNFKKLFFEVCFAPTTRTWERKTENVSVFNNQISAEKNWTNNHI